MGLNRIRTTRACSGSAVFARDKHAFVCSSTSSPLAVLDIGGTSCEARRSYLGDLGLSAAEENALVAFMTTLSDGYIKK